VNVAQRSVPPAVGAVNVEHAIASAKNLHFNKKRLSIDVFCFL